MKVMLLQESIAIKNAVENNRLSTPLEKIRIKELAAQGVATEEELKAIACALHKCSAQYEEGSPEFIAAQLLEEQGMKDENTALREQLANQKYIISYKDPRTGKQVEIVVTDLFNYTTLDYILDGATYSDGKFHLTERGLGALQAAGGLSTMLSGVAACTSILGCFGGSVVSTIGADQFWAGYNRLLSGQEQKTAGAALLETLGVPPEYSEIIYRFTDAYGVAKIAFKSTKTGAVVEVALDKNAKDAVIRSGTIDSKTGKFKPTEVAAKIPIDQYKKLQAASIKNANSDTLVLGKYTSDESSYLSIAKKENATYFDMGDDWNKIKTKYNFTDEDMFNFFNVPVLDEAITKGKTIKFTHNPNNYPGSALAKELQYLKSKGYIFDESTMTAILKSK